MRKLNEERKNFLDKKIKFKEHSIKIEELELDFFEDIKTQNPRLKELIEEVGKDYKPFKELQEDIFSSLFRWRPEKEKEDRMKASHLLNWHVMDLIMKLPRYEELRVTTLHDDVSSTVGTEILSDKAYQLIKEHQEFLEGLQKVEAAEGEFEKAQEELEEAEQSSEKESEGAKGVGKAKSKEYTLKEAQKRLEEARKDLSKATRKKTFVKKLQKVIDDTQDEVVETSEMIQNWGLNSNNSYTNMPYEKKMELLQRLRSNDKLKKIAELGGRFKRIATQQQKEKVKRGMDEIYSIIPGNDLTRLLPQEYLKLKNPLTKKICHKDFIERKLLQYSIRGKEKKYKGPIVCCIDSSGSMAGGAEIWSKAVALALLEVALYQKRSFFCIHFEAERNPNHLHTNEFPKGAEKDIEEIIDMAEYFLGGGTLFEPPLDRSRSLIDTEKDYNKADIVFITDGESVVGEKWLSDYLDWKKKNNIKIHSILIDGGWSSSSASLELFSDSINKLSIINEEQSENLALNLFNAM